MIKTIRFGLLFFLFFLLPNFFFAQEDENSTRQKEQKTLTIENIRKDFSLSEPKTKSPTKAALYSAILPGLGQVYNQRYWKAPIVWGLLGTSVSFVSFFQNQHDDLREAFIAELNGEEHQFSDIGLSADTLGQAQADEKRSRDYAIAITTLIYILNILDAAIDAHLFEVRQDKDLTIQPTTVTGFGQLGFGQLPGVGVSYRF